jgi:hypothetical protein
VIGTCSGGILVRDRAVARRGTGSEPARQLGQESPGEPVEVTGTTEQCGANLTGTGDQFLVVHVMLPASCPLDPASTI